MSQRRAQELIALGDRLFNKRQPLLSLWQEIAENFYPERADFTSAHSFGDDFAAHLMSSYPVLLRRNLGDMISAMLRPRDRQWFRVTTLDEDRDRDTAIAQGLGYLRDTLRSWLYDPRAQFARATKHADHDFVTFGQAVISMMEHRDRDRIAVRNWHLRDCAWLENSDGEIDHLHRKAEMDARAMLQAFSGPGVTLHDSIRRAAEKEPNRPIKYRVVCMPTHEYDLTMSAAKGGGKKFAYCLCYVDIENGQVITEQGVHGFPYIVPRWHTVSGWPYAYSPATSIALPDSRLMQQMTRILLESGEKAVDPPVVAVAEAVREVNIQAGAITWADMAYDERLGEVVRPLNLNHDMRTAFSMQADLRELLAQAFFRDKLQLPEAGANMTAYEVSRRLEEHVRNTLPLFEPIEMEYNVRLLDRAFALIANMGAFDWSVLPEQLSGSDLSFSFESPIQAATSRLRVQHYSEGLQLVGAAMQAGMDVNPLRLDVATKSALLGTGMDAEWIMTDAEIAAAREMAAKQREITQALQGLREKAENVGAIADQVGRVRDAFAPPEEGILQ